MGAPSNGQDVFQQIGLTQILEGIFTTRLANEEVLRLANMQHSQDIGAERRLRFTGNLPHVSDDRHA